LSVTNEGRIMTWNTAAEKLLGYSAQETADQSLTLLLPAEERSKTDEATARVLRGEPAQPWQTKLKRKDGSLVEVSLAASCARDAEGRIIGAALVARPKG
jgi:PAS domain S-box-containing protein